MSRLYTVRANAGDLARHFEAEEATGMEVPSEMVEGLPGLVAFEAGGRRLLKPMTWGFPRLTREMKARGDPPGRIGLVADLTNPMWSSLVVDPRYRCLIPLTHFANPDGVPGSKTRTWFSVKDQPLIAWAGFCRNMPEAGPAYAGMTMEANAAIPPTNERMPVLLERDDYDRWLHGTVKDVIDFQFREPIPAERMFVERTNHRWRDGGLPKQPSPQFALL